MSRGWHGEYRIAARLTWKYYISPANERLSDLHWLLLIICDSTIFSNNPGSVSPGGLVRPNIRSFSYSASGLQHCHTLVSQLTRKVSSSRSCKQFKGWKRTKYNLLFLSVDWRLNTDDNWLFFWAAKIKELFEKNESKAFYAWDKPLDVKRKRVVDDIGLVAEQRIDNAW